MDRKAQHDISRKLKVLNYAKEINNISKTCRYFGICRETFYKWKRAYEANGKEALLNNKPCPKNHKLRIPKAVEEKVVHLRTTYHFGSNMIVWHLPRYHNIKTSSKDKQGGRIKRFQYTGIDDCPRIRALKIA